MVAWFTGLGIAMKVLIGLTVAAAASATGVGALGAINGLVSSPTHQETTSTDEPTDDPTKAAADKSETFGSKVSDRAHELGKDGDGHASGQETSQEAQQLGDDKRQNISGNGNSGNANGNGNSGNGDSHKPDERAGSGKSD